MARYDIGGMLARSGQAQGQQIASGFEQFGKGLGSMLTGVGTGLASRRERKDKEATAQEAQALLQKYANNPAQLNALGQKYATEGNDALSKLFLDAAKTANQRQVAVLEEAGAQITATTEAARKKGQLRDALMAAREREDTNAVRALSNRSMSASEYLKSIATKTPAKPVSISPGGALVSPTGEVLYERPFKPQAPAKSKGIQTITRDDGSVSVLDADTGDLISTLPPTGAKDEVSQEASLNLIAQTTGFIQEIDELMDPGFTEAGFVGGVSQAIPGTPAYDREKELLSIRARLGFDQINEMKRLAAESGASGTGLGQISNIEFMSLQSTIDAIYTGMSGEAQNKALENIKKHLLNVQKLASGVAPADAIEWDRPEYAAVGYAKDKETEQVYYAPDGRNGTMYVLKNGKFEKLGI
ncbi:MAG: hypothetical protein VW715_16765 [Rhodospirillales bacterium]